MSRFGSEERICAHYGPVLDSVTAMSAWNYAARRGQAHSTRWAPPSTPPPGVYLCVRYQGAERRDGQLHTETEKAKKDWDTRQPQFEEAVKHVEAWEDPKAKLLRTLVDGIRKQAANTRRRPRPS